MKINWPVNSQPGAFHTGFLSKKKDKSSMEQSSIEERYNLLKSTAIIPLSNSSLRLSSLL